MSPEAFAATEIDAANPAERRGAMGGSDIACLLGVDPYKTAHQLYREKLDPFPVEQTNAHIRRGRRQEAVALDVYAELHPTVRLHRGFVTARGPFRMHLDAVGITKPDEQGNVTADSHLYPIEGKAPSRFAYLRIQKTGMIPLQYELQCMAYAYGIAAPGGDVMAYCADLDEGDVYPVQVDLELMAEAERRAVAFLAAVERRDEAGAIAVVNGVPEVLKDLRPQHLQLVKDVTLPASTDPAVIELAARYHDIGQLEKQLADERAKVREALLAHVTGELRAGGYKVTRYAIAGRASLDRKALERQGVLDPIAVGMYFTARQWPMPTAEEIESLRFDLARVTKTGKPSEGLRVSEVGDEEGKADDND